MTPAYLLTIDDLRLSVKAAWPNLAVDIVDAVDSTNLELQRRWRAGQTLPQLLMAHNQTAGRGRLGRQWHSQSGASLTFSLGLPLPAQDWSGLSLVVGLAVAKALHPAIGLKWPNDLWVKQGTDPWGKLGGILIESISAGGAMPHAATGSAATLLVIGIGVNVTAQPMASVSVPPAHLQSLIPGITPLQALQQLAPPLLGAIAQFLQTGFAPFMAAFGERDLLAGHPVVLSDGQSGLACGVDTDGALLVRTNPGTAPQRVVSGEVSVRPANPRPGPHGPQSV